MISSTSILDLKYLPSPWQDRVHAICSSWKGTRYKLNGKLRGRGVDCLHFAAGVLDELFGIAHSKNLKSLPPDACVHNKPGVWKAVKALLRTYPCLRIRNNSVEAGDLVIVGRHGPEHLMVASKQSILWEATFPCVRPTGYGAPDDYRLIAIYRARDKNLWST